MEIVIINAVVNQDELSQRLLPEESAGPRVDFVRRVKPGWLTEKMESV